MSNILLIPRIKIQNANALSSPYTIGFPAMTAWLGGVHALQRKLKPTFNNLTFSRVGVACHHIDLQTYKGKSDYIHSILGTSNPLDKNGDRPSFIEEARCHLTVSLIIEYDGLSDWGDEVEDSEFFAAVTQQLQQLKLASGDILNTGTLQRYNPDVELNKLIQKLMPSYILIERRDLMIAAMQEQPDAMNALLDYLTVQHRSETIKQENKEDEIKWTAKRKTTGWIVPIATGFHGISELGTAQYQRDPDTAHRFAESIITLGEFKMPYHFKHINEMLWHTHTDLENNLYLCQQ